MADQRGTSVVVLVMIGLPAAGKSTLAGLLKSAAAAELHSDAVRSVFKQPQLAANTAAASATAAAATTTAAATDHGNDTRSDMVEPAQVFGHVRLLTVDDVVYDPEIHPAAPRTTTTAAPTAGSLENAQNIESGSCGGDDGDEGGLTWRQQRQAVLLTLKGWLDDLVPLSVPPPQHERRGGGSALHTLVVDDNMYYSSMRYQLYQLVREYSVGFAQVLVECHVDTAVARDKARRLGVGEVVIRRMGSRIEAPSPTSNSWERHSVTVPSTGTGSPEGSARALREVVAAARADPTAPVAKSDLGALELSRQVNAASAKKQLDASTRKIMATAMAAFAKTGPTKAASKLYATRLTKIRKQMLKDFRADGTNVVAADIKAKIEAFELETTAQSN